MRLTPDDFATDELVRCAPPRETRPRHPFAHRRAQELGQLKEEVGRLRGGSV